MRRIIVGLAVLILLATQARAENGPVVVELFTSQGCSSCPPADIFLTDLAHTRGDVLPLAFHVTYWNYLGWKDPFSLDAATARQRDYARYLGEDGVYTPQMVVDGSAGFVGSDRNAGLAAISKASAKSVPLSVHRDDGQLTIVVGSGPGQGQVLLVGYDPSHRTAIGRGENSGHTLEESNIVRSLTPVGSWTGSQLIVRHQLPAGEAYAALLQAQDGHIIGAARLSP
jgi:hypothetical protein